MAKRGADDLAAISICELIGRHPRVDWSAVDDVMLGCANQACEDNRNIVGMAWTGAFHPL